MPTLSKYIKDIQKFAEANPELLSKHVGYVTDDEGNSFSINIYPPTITWYNKEDDERLSNEDYETYKEDDRSSVKGFKKYVVIN